MKKLIPLIVLTVFSSSLIAGVGGGAGPGVTNKAFDGDGGGWWATPSAPGTDPTYQAPYNNLSGEGGSGGGPRQPHQIKVLNNNLEQPLVICSTDTVDFEVPYSTVTQTMKKLKDLNDGPVFCSFE